ncbi:MAG: GGDEF domain-containing protein [Actinomycetota bacterium]
MQDPRLVLAVGAGVAALAAGVVGVATDSTALGIVAGVAGVLAATAGVALGARARDSEDRLAAAEEEIERVTRELASINAVIHEEASRRAAEAELGPVGPPIRAPKGEHAFDAATGLYDEKYFAVLVQQQVAAARRSLRPLSVVIFEIDAMGESDRETQQQALGVVGDVVRRTLRESDAACRLGDLMVGAILEDTPEAGAVWAAERVRGSLLGSPIGDALTLSAGVACYPTHALGAAELVQQAGRALDEARSRGRDRVELAPDA